MPPYPSEPAGVAALKHQFVEEYRAGRYGNASPTWGTLEEWIESRFTSGLFHLRNRRAAGETRYNLTPAQVKNLWPVMKEPADWYLSAMAPHDKNVIQGEVYEGPGGLYLMYSPVLGKPMRDALAEKTYHLHGLMAKVILKRSLCDRSWDWLRELFDRYPGHIVEFSTFSVPWGTLYPLYNTVFWEIRSY